MILSVVSIQRLAAYHDELTLWQDNLVHQPNDPIAHNNLARALREAGRPEEAIQHLEEALLENPNIAEIQYNLGNALSSEHPEEAVQHYQLALQINPQYAEAYNNLAWLFATTRAERVRDPLRAIELAQKAIELQPNRAGILNTLGVASYRAGRWQETIDWLDRSAKANGGRNCFDCFFLAMAHQRLGHSREARIWYDKAVELMRPNDPHNTELNRVRREAEDTLANQTAVESKPDNRN